MMRCGVALILGLVATLGSPVCEAGTTPVDAGTQWQFALTPYIWLPSVSGTTRFTLPAGGTDASTGPYNYLQHLQFALMLQGEARKGDWSLFADTIYLNFGRDGSSVNTRNGVFGVNETQRSFQTGLSGAVIQLGSGYTVVRRPWGTVDAILGMRYLGVNESLDASFSATSGSGRTVVSALHTSASQSIFDGFTGVRGRLSITEDGRWYVPYYVDVGAGSSKFTWQAMGGVGYAAKWGDLNLTYRYLAFYGSGDQLVQTLRFNGPSMSATFRF